MRQKLSRTAQVQALLSRPDHNAGPAAPAQGTLVMTLLDALQMNELPRRVTIDHPNYDVLCGMPLRITLDGVEQRHVVAYDMDAGVVERC